jgi:hypothetical protein
MSARRPSPILLKDEPKPSKADRIKEWFGRFLNRPDPATTQRIHEVLGRAPLSAPGSAAEAAEEDLGYRATVQLLPGRLEPLIPEVIQQEVRFQRDNSPGEQEITLGWEMGDPPHHVTLDHPSIQALHAKMTFQKGRWMIKSLVPDDPVEVNGTPVPVTNGPYLLASGDKVRIGEALFRFHLP